MRRESPIIAYYNNGIYSSFYPEKSQFHAALMRSILQRSHTIADALITSPQDIELYFSLRLFAFSRRKRNELLLWKPDAAGNYILTQETKRATDNFQRCLCWIMKFRKRSKVAVILKRRSLAKS